MSRLSEILGEEEVAVLGGMSNAETDGKDERLFWLQA